MITSFIQPEPEVNKANALSELGVRASSIDSPTSATLAPNVVLV